MKRWIRRVGVGVASVVAATLVAGSAYEFIGRYQAARRFPPPGRMVDVGGGRRIQLDCRGSGSPTVVFESGLDPYGSLSWVNVQDPIAAVTRACAYSRAGILWSDPLRGPQSGELIARDLHAALAAGGEQGPFVMVGHSLGGPYLIIYTKYFGSEVAGLVLVDASHPDQEQRLGALLPGVGTAHSGHLAHMLPALSWTGVVRLMAPRFAEANSPPHQPVHDLDAVAAYASTTLVSMLEEGEALEATLADSGSLRTLGTRPVYVLTSMAPLPQQQREQLMITPEQALQFKTLWRELQDDEATWSSRSTHQLVSDSGHYIQFERPGIVINAVISTIESVRATQSAAVRPSH
jgi:pimeloyl-ACP methyl ester carboxylesterase